MSNSSCTFDVSPEQELTLTLLTNSNRPTRPNPKAYDTQAINLPPKLAPVNLWQEFARVSYRLVPFFSGAII